MKKTILFLTIYCILFSLSAQGHLDGGATALLREISNKYQKFATMQIDYSYKAEKDQKVSDTQKGKIKIKGSQYYFTFAGQAFYCDGVSIWNYQKESNEISIFEYDDSDDNMINPAKLLAGWEKNFRAKIIREEFENNKNLILIDLTPIKNESYYRIRLYIDKAKNEIIRVAVYEKDNTIYTYFFDKFITNVPMDDKQFKLNPADYPNAQINDMR